MALLGLEIVCVCGYIDWLLVAGRVWWTLRRSVSRFPLRLQSRDVVFVEGMGEAVVREEGQFLLSFLSSYPLLLLLLGRLWVWQECA